MTDTTPAKTTLDLDAITAKWLQQCGACDAGLGMSCTCPPGDPRNVIDALVTEAATLRRELAELRSDYDEIGRQRNQLLAAEQRLGAELESRGFPPLWSVNTDVLAALDTLRQGRDEARGKLDEAVAETARVRTVYRDALARWRDELTQLRKAVTTIAARRERERPDDIIVDALRAALDGAATTGPETAPRVLVSDGVPADAILMVPQRLPYETDEELARRSAKLTAAPPTTLEPTPKGGAS